MAEIAKTVDHALRLLLLLGERGPSSPAELARLADLNRTVVHRLLTTLHGRGFVSPTRDGYVPGAVLLRMAERVRPDLRATARLVMAELAEEIAETVVMHTPDGDDAVVLDQVVAGGKLVRVEHEVGSRHPLHGGASGRALLAFMPPAIVERIVSQATDPTALTRALESVTQLGYAISHDELQDGVYGLAVPVLGRDCSVVASLAVLVPATRATNMTQHLTGLSAASERVAAGLGASGATSRGGHRPNSRISRADGLVR